MGLGAWDGWLSLFEELTLTEINHKLLLYPSPGSRKLLVDFRIPKLLRQTDSASSILFSRWEDRDLVLPVASSQNPPWGPFLGIRILRKTAL